MEVLNLENEPALFLPIHCFADNVISDKSEGTINLNVATNRFFKYLNVVGIDEENIQIGSGIAADRADAEPGIVLITHKGTLAVIGEEYTAPDGKQYWLPVIWNGCLVANSETDDPQEDYYKVVCRDEAGTAVGAGCVVYEMPEDIFWNDFEQDSFYDAVYFDIKKEKA